jgi:hypothetical protein
MEAARATLSTLPLVERGLIDFELIALRAYPGFARLFAEGALNAAPDGPGLQRGPL